MTGRICTVDGCSKKHAAKGFCMNHYNFYHIYGDPLAIPKRAGLRPERAPRLVPQLGVAYVPLAGGRAALIDIADASKVAGYGWSIDGGGYPANRRRSMHRVIMDAWCPPELLLLSEADARERPAVANRLMGVEC